MSLQTLENVVGQFGQLFQINTNSLSEVLIVIGFSILLLALVIGITYGIMKAIKEVPNMPFRQFVAMVLVVAVFMVIVGVLLP
ncbi:MAG: hypothetical protein L7H21_00075 [Sulfolobales archaeon]|nr:hypothetical protein [Sulfolobales archaeon]MCG2893565.1 hypothetical protein [Sulfolobales archaeon]MCG2910039.1 hypothetical protein [Sulfolobales archaeon]MCQ4343733.1 hypothetical protein [Sulfolobales archaeon]